MSSLEQEQVVEREVPEKTSEDRPYTQDFWTLRERLLEMGVSEEHLDRHLPSDPEDFANHT